jgi:hypothetical protein
MDEIEQLAERVLLAMLASVSDLEATRKPEVLRQALVGLAFDLAERFVAERDRRRSST